MHTDWREFCQDWLCGVSVASCGLYVALGLGRLFILVSSNALGAVPYKHTCHQQVLSLRALEVAGALRSGPVLALTSAGAQLE